MHQVIHMSITQVGKKSESSAVALMCVAAVLLLHLPALLWLLNSERLWRGFFLLAPASVPTVRLSHTAVGWTISELHDGGTLESLVLSPRIKHDWLKV